MKSELPTKPGPFYWREKDGDEWEHIIVMDPGNGHLYGHSLRPDGVVAASLNDWAQDYGAVGEWHPILPADELLELQRKAKMVDAGQEVWIVRDVEDNEVIAASSINRDDAVLKAWHTLGDPRETSQCPGGYTCEPVTILRKEKR